MGLENEPLFFSMKRRLMFSIGVPSVLLALAFLWPLPTEFRAGVRSVKMTDREGRLLYDVRGNGLSSFAPLASLPDDIRLAVISTEDRTFLHHPGLSLRGILRAAWHDILAGRIVEGGSTITQQLVRVTLQPVHRGVFYKLREAWLAVKIDARWTKDQILEAYLNQVYFGQQSYGIVAASRTYFDKVPKDLSLAESALLVGLVNAPTSLNPFQNPKAATKRRNVVLLSMFQNNAITQHTYEEALQEPFVLSHGRVPIRAPHFVFWLLSQHPELRLEQGDIRTTIDLDVQTAAEEIVSRQLYALREKNVTAAAIVVLDAVTGDILTMVGSGDYFDDEHDGAVNVAVSLRQPGSALKPFTYAIALQSGMTAASTVSDTEARYFTQDGNPYTPRNYDYLEHGLVRLREALANSYNIAAVRVLEKVGVSKLLNFLKQAGISTLTQSPEHYGLALTLGGSEVKLLDLTAAYGIFPRKGKTLHPRGLLSQSVSDGQSILDEHSAWIISDILSDDDARRAEFGEGGALSFGFPVAAKTGTTRNSRDNWTIGYTPRHIVGVWVGNADNAPMIGTSGVTGAGPIFHDVMSFVERDEDSNGFVMPRDMQRVEVCRLSGKLPTDDCPDRINEYFAPGTIPDEKDDLYVRRSIDKRNGLLARETCDPAVVEVMAFVAFPSDTVSWARENGWRVPPVIFSPLCGEEDRMLKDAVKIVRPTAQASFVLDPLIPDENEKILFEAQTSSAIEMINWYVDDKFVGTGRYPDFRFRWQPQEGWHIVQAGTGASAAQAHIEIKR